MTSEESEKFLDFCRFRRIFAILEWQKRGVFSPLYGRIAPRSVRLNKHKFRSLRASAFRRAEQRPPNALWRTLCNSLSYLQILKAKLITLPENESRIDQRIFLCYTILYQRQEVGRMLCHLVINLSDKLCTRSDDWTKFVQR